MYYQVEKYFLFEQKQKDSELKKPYIFMSFVLWKGRVHIWKIKHEGMKSDWRIFSGF